MKRLPALLVLLVFLCSQTLAQQAKAHPSFPGGVTPFYPSPTGFVENIGQYGPDATARPAMGPVLYAYEGALGHILFTAKGLVYVQKKRDKISHREEEALEKQGASEELIESKAKGIVRIMTMEWSGANPAVEIRAENKTADHHTYPLLTAGARGFARLVYHDLYPGIDLIYDIDPKKAAGFEYSLVVHPGAELAAVQMKFDEVDKLRIDGKGQLVYGSRLGNFIESKPAAFVSNGDAYAKSGSTNQLVKFIANGRTVGFASDGYDRTKTLVIDPWITPATNFTGINSGKAIDVDYDKDGNVYVAGGDYLAGKIAKFSNSGVLQWTFVGTLGAVPGADWVYGPYCGGWTVEKSTGKVYVAQGVDIVGMQMIRLTNQGVYDNYITTPIEEVWEGWRMTWSCWNGVPELQVGVGTVVANYNLCQPHPPSPALNPTNTTGIPYVYGLPVSTGWGQDVVDAVIDPVSNDLYTIYSSNGSPINNKIFKQGYPYTPATIGWQQFSDFNVLVEGGNRGYISGYGGSYKSTASLNMLALNGQYLFYWDGKNLKAFTKSTGASAGQLITPLEAIMESGIYADECNNVYIGYTNGTIKVYRFTGTGFDDAGAPDISIPGFPNGSVYALSYDPAARLLYASGDGFVAALDISSYCNRTSPFLVNLSGNCGTQTITATVTPAAPANVATGYALYDAANNLVASNSTGIFTGVAPGSYQVKASMDNNCRLFEARNTISFCRDTVILVPGHTHCGHNDGTLTVSPIFGAAPYQYSKDGVTYQSSNVFNQLAAGSYTITVKDGAGLTKTATAIIQSSTGITLAQTVVSPHCGLANGSVTGIGNGGTQPYQYSLDGSAFQAAASFGGLAAANYTLYAKDAGGCTAQSSFILAAVAPPALALNGTSVSCNLNDGNITATGSLGTAPYQFSIDGVSYQSSGSFGGLSAGNHTIYLKDANGCTAQTTIALAQAALPTASVSATQVGCNGNNGTITVTAAGGTSPYQYSIDGSSYQASGSFTGLGSASYSITVRDTRNCLSAAVPVTLVRAASHTANGTATDATCLGNDGSISLSAQGGTGPYTYSLNNGSYQTSNIFNGLAPGSYPVSVRDNNGCTSAAALVLDVHLLDNLVVDAGNDLAVCNGLPVTLLAASNAASFSWQPAADLDRPTALQPVASPRITTKYYLTATTGICTKKDSVTVSVYDLPQAQAGRDTVVCQGQTFNLHGSGGVAFSWQPATSLNDAHGSDPQVIRPTTSTTYQLTVQDAHGCTSAPDAVTVTVLPPVNLFAGRDTIVLEGQYLTLSVHDLNNNTLSTYLWSPATGLSNPQVSNPVATISNDITYHVDATTDHGCTGAGQISIKVVRTVDIYVPSAFTPNHDGLNDVLRAMPVGLRSFTSFRVYNRWGAIVFATTDARNGWDGLLNGVPQPSNTYVWIAEGTDLYGNHVQRKGVVVLVR